MQQVNEKLYVIVDDKEVVSEEQIQTDGYANYVTGDGVRPRIGMISGTIVDGQHRHAAALEFYQSEPKMQYWSCVVLKKGE